MKRTLLAAALLAPVLASAQIPDLLNTLEPGSPSLGAAGAFDPTASNTFSTFYNPAGLGYIRRRQVTAAYRNLPRSTTTLSGDFANPAYDTNAQRGGNTITHIGYAQPLGQGGIGASYTVGGYLDDDRSGTGLSFGNFNLTNYTEEIRVKSEFFTVGYGRTNRTGNVSFGAGVVVAKIGVTDRTSGTLLDAQNQPQPFTTADNSSTGTGLGAIVGIQFSPVSAPQTSWGLSVRTPIELSGNSETSDLYDRVPGVARLGFASRSDLKRGDSVTYGAQVSHFFGGDGDQILDRSSQTTFGIGAEYGLARGAAVIPLRLGYMFVPSGGDGFGRRDALTLGTGYRPNDGKFSLDLAYVLPRASRKSNDFTVTATYRFN